MILSPTCVLGYAMPSLQGCMPCIFVINVVTSTSMQSSSRDVADFRDLEFFQVISLMLFLCHVFMLLQWDPCFFWVCLVWMIWAYDCAISTHVPVCIYGVPYHNSILLYFCYKMFLADCLRVNQFCQGCCSWSMHAMILFLPCLASWACLLAGSMISLSCNALCWVHRARKHAFIILNLLTKLAMFTWVPSYLLILFGLWSVSGIYPTA